MIDSNLPEQVRSSFKRHFSKYVQADRCDQLLHRVGQDWKSLVEGPPLTAFRGIVVSPIWLEETRPSPTLDLGSWWTSHRGYAEGYAVEGDALRYDESRWEPLVGETRCKVLLEAEFPAHLLDMPAMLMRHYTSRGLRPFSFELSESFFREGTEGTLVALTADGACVADHPLLGARFRVKLDGISFRILPEYVGCEGWDEPVSSSQ